MEASEAEADKADAFFEANDSPALTPDARAWNSAELLVPSTKPSACTAQSFADPSGINSPIAYSLEEYVPSSTATPVRYAQSLAFDSASSADA